MFKRVINNTRFQFASLVFILVFSVIFILFYIGIKISTLTEINTLHNDLNNFTAVSSDLDYKLNNFKTYNHSSAFYETFRDESTKAIVNDVLILHNIINRLQKNKSVRNYNIISYINQNNILLMDYDSKFSELIKYKVGIGNDKFGYIEKLNYFEKRIENLINNDNSLKPLFNKIKSNKVQFFQSYSSRNADVFRKSINSFIVNAKQNSNYTHLNKNILLDATINYLNYFIQINKSVKKLGTNDYKGLYFELASLSNELILNISASIEESKSYINKDYREFKTRTLLFISFSALIIILILFLMYRVYIKGISKIQDEIKDLVFKDNYDTDGNFYNNITKMLSEHRNNIDYKKELIYNFAKGKANKEYSFKKEDELGQSIVYLREKILEEINKASIESARRKIEDMHKEGIARFGRILRRHIGDIDTLSYEIISELVSFIKADIGGLYVKGSNNTLNLRASFAYNEKKLINKQIAFGEGLVGTCAVDKSTIFIDKVDDDYIKIISGFGHTKPTSIIISPIMVEKEVYGVIELGSTHLFNQDDINFIESLTEDIAYTLSYLLSLEATNKEQ